MSKSEVKRKDIQRGKLLNTEEELEHIKKILSTLGWRLANKGGITPMDWKELVIDELDKQYG